MTSEILIENIETQKELSGLLSSIDEVQINAVPFEGSWTAGQLAEHLIKSGSGILRVFHGATKPADRDPAEKIATIRKTFLDFNTKLKAPDFIKPTNDAKVKTELLNSITRITEGLDKDAKNLDLALRCEDLDLPALGKLTRLEWSHFMLYHTRRHIHQLKNIIQKLN